MEHNDIIAYKTWIENLDEPAPEGAWDSLADQLDIDAAWDSIAETLDLDAVWQNVDTSLPPGITVSIPDKTLHFPKIFWVAAALVLFTLTTPISDERLAYDQTMLSNGTVDNDDSIKGDAAGHSEKESTIDHLDTNAKGSINKVSPNNTGVRQKSDYKSIILYSVEVEPVSTIPENEPPFSELKQSIIKLSAENVLADSVKKLMEHDSVQVAVLVSKEDSVVEKPTKRAQWQIGIIGSVKNTWLINPETTNGLKRTSLNDTRLTFGKEFGVTLQRSISNQSALQVEYYFYSQIGQRYHEYINALYQTKDIRLRYQKVQVVYRTRIFNKISTPALYVVGGIRISRLTLADTSIGGEDEIVTQEYRPWDYGFIVGGETEFNLGTRFLLVSGVRASYGIRNIYLGNGQTLAEFNKTHTASVGIMVGLKYRIN